MPGPNDYPVKDGNGNVLIPASQGVGVVPGQSRSGKVAVDNSNLFMFAGNGFRANVQRYVPGASALFGVMEKVFISDPYWTYAPRFLFANWYLTTNAAGAQEAANGNAITIEDVSLQINGGSRVRLTFSGATGAALADDAEVWSDANELIAIPPNSVCRVAVAWAVPNSASNLSAPANGLSPMFGDRGEVSTGTLAAKVMAGGVSTTAPTGSNIYAYGPCAMVAKGWDGRPVGLVLGTSIEQGVGSSRLYRDAYGEIGPTGRGMATRFNGAPRYPAANFSVSGGFAAGIAGAAGILRRVRAFAAIASGQGGVLPFTFVLSGFGTNDQTATLATWKTAMSAMLAAVRAAWPTARLVQSTLWPRVTSTDAFTTLANQTVSSNWTVGSGSAMGLRQWMLALCDGLIDAVVDIQATIDGGDTDRNKWRVDILPAWATTLSGTIAGGVSAFTVAAQPRPGSTLAINDGTHEALSVASTPSTAAPFTVNTLAAAAGAHTAGATVKETTTIDGVHPGDLIAGYVAEQCYAKHKLAGTFG